MLSATPQALPMSGERVRVRHLRETDLDAFQHYRRDPALAKFQGWTGLDDNAALAFLREMSIVKGFNRGEWTQLGIAHAEDDSLIGDIGIYLDGSGEYAEIGISLARSAQGHGFAREAASIALELVFATPTVHRVLAITDARNERSIKLWLRLGMRLVRTQEVEFRGEPCVEHVYALERGQPQTSNG